MKHRGLVLGTKGMVASANSIISSSGLNILNQGGNAIDACVCMALTSSVVLPDMCGLGGDAFLLYYDAKNDKITAINGSGNVGKKATLDYFKQHGYTSMPKDGILSVSVPGAVDVYFTILEKFGTKTFSELSKDAITLGREGVPIGEKVIRHCYTDFEKMKRFDALKDTYLNKGKQYQIGDIVKNEALAKSFEYLNIYGRDGFYKGKIKDDIIKLSDSLGGLLEAQDFENYHCELLEPISISYQHHTIVQTPPVSQGIILLEELGILDNFHLDSKDRNTAKAIHLMVQAKRQAFKDRELYFGDPKFIDNPLMTILSDDYLSQKVNEIKKEIITQDCFTHQNNHTTSFVAIDKWGNAVSFIHSISATWGSGIMVDGFLLNNRATSFSLDKASPNCIMPGKRTMHTLNTYMILDENKRLKYIGNTPGGDNQPQWNMQNIVSILNYGLDVQSALEEPKWSDIFDGKNFVLHIENTIENDELEKLKDLGYSVKIVDSYGLTGASELIEIKENGVRVGASDPRADGCAMQEI